MTMPNRRVWRQILCTCSTPAAAIAERVLALSRRGMTEPPLTHLAAPAAANAALDKQIEDACDLLADLERAERQRRQGIEIVTPDELHIWLLLDLRPGESSAGSPSAIISPAEIAQLQAAMQRGVWQRLRAHVAWHAVLLLEAAAQDLLVTWAAALHAESEAQVYVMSPVNAQHLRMAENAWTEQVAQSITALLWTAPPAHSQIEWVATGVHTLAAMAAVVWCSPAQPLHAWLAQAGAAQIIQLLHGEFAPPAEEVRAGLAEVPPGAPTLAGDLATLHRRPLTPPQLVLPTGYPSWPALARLPDDVGAEIAKFATTYARQSQQLRMAWLDDAQSAWDELLQGIEVSRIVQPPWPRLRSYRTALDALRDHIHTQAQQAGDQMEAAGARLEQAAQEADAALRRLHTLCAAFPACTPRGVFAAVLQPWKWLRWAYSYWQELPDVLQQIAATEQDVERRRHEEATWHTLRQHYLAAAQQVQIRSTRLQQLEASLAAAQVIAADAGSMPAEIPAPWTLARLKRLLSRLLPDVTRIQMDKTLTRITNLELSPHDLVTELNARVGAEIEAVKSWPALDCLAAAFAIDLLPGEALGDAPGRWFEQQLHATAPLWPAQELAENALAEDWWSAPELETQTEWVAAAAAIAAAWRTQFPAARVARSALDAVQIVRWAELRAELEVSEQDS